MEPKNPHTQRLEILRAKLVLNWGELADHLGISRAMLDFVRAGSRAPSPKTLRLIESAERAAGLLPPVAAPAPVVEAEEHLTGEQKAAMVFDSQQLRALQADYAAIKNELADLRREMQAGRIASDQLLSDALAELRALRATPGTPSPSSAPPGKAEPGLGAPRRAKKPPSS